jgi:hypothetical protein
MSFHRWVIHGIMYRFWRDELSVSEADAAIKEEQRRDRAALQALFARESP